MVLFVSVFFFLIRQQLFYVPDGYRLERVVYHMNERLRNERDRNMYYIRISG